jgi:hypothetical protein
MWPFFLLSIVGAASATLIRLTIYDQDLSPPCEFPRYQQTISLPWCDSSDMIVYNTSTKLLSLYAMSDTKCVWPAPYNKQTVIQQDVCNTNWEIRVLEDDEKDTPNIDLFGRNITLQTFSSPKCQGRSSVVHREMGKCYQTPYLGSYALVGFKNETIVEGYVWENNNQCQGDHDSWLYILQDHCSPNGIGSWIGYFY